jgi:hypothetical protein
LRNFGDKLLYIGTIIPFITSYWSFSLLYFLFFTLFSLLTCPVLVCFSFLLYLTLMPQRLIIFLSLASFLYCSYGKIEKNIRKICATFFMRRRRRENVLKENFTRSYVACVEMKNVITYEMLSLYHTWISWTRNTFDLCNFNLLRLFIMSFMKIFVWHLVAVNSFLFIHEN